MTLKAFGLGLLRFTLAMAVMLLFFQVAPWWASQPLSDLDPDQIPASGVPSWARSFNNSHGTVVFNVHATVREAPHEFAIWMAAWIAVFACLYFSFPKHLRGPGKYIRRRRMGF